MDKFAFTPIVDVPLAAAVLAIFLWHFQRWAGRRVTQSSLDLAARLPQARLRVIALVVCVLMLCWWVDLAFWSLGAVLLALGIVIALICGGDFEGGAFGFAAVAYLIREWAFGFPQLILHPPQASPSSTAERSEFEQLIGRVGKTTSALCPSGHAMFDGVSYSVVSYDGTMIDVGTTVVVQSHRNRSLCVAPASAQDDTSAPHVPAQP